MDGKTASELVQELVDIHCRTQIRFRRRQELIQEQEEDDSKFDIASSLLKPLLTKLDGPVHYRHGWENHYAIRLDDDTKLVLVEKMLELLDLEIEDDRLISDDCLAAIEKDLAKTSKDNQSVETSTLDCKPLCQGVEYAWQQTSNDGQ